MSAITLELPSQIANLLGCGRTIRLEAATLSGSLDVAIALHPPLAGHLFDESGNLRPHVLCFLNETNSRWLEGMSASVKDGDVITIVQAVSGGASPKSVGVARLRRAGSP